VDSVETQMLLVSVELCDKDQDLLVLMKRELSIIRTKRHFERHFFISSRSQRCFICPCTRYM